jgi:hypothetical protein
MHPRALNEHETATAALSLRLDKTKHSVGSDGRIDRVTTSPKHL